MTAYVIRRLISMVPTLIAISLLVFVIIQLPPGDIVTLYIAQLETMGADTSSMDAEQIRAAYGLDKPFFARYVLWVSGLLRGDLGASFLYYDVPVLTLLLSRIGGTLAVTISALVISWLISIPIGIYAATHPYSLGDHVFTVLAFIGKAIPNFFLALLLMTAAAMFWNASVGGLHSREFVGAPWDMAKWADFAKHLWIPMLVLGTARMADITRIMRSNLMDVLQLQYVETARAKGLHEWVVIYKHAVRNALHPLIMMLGTELPGLLSGATIVAIVLSLPTVGALLYDALIAQDMYLAGSLLMVQVLLLLFGNLVADILLAWVDPRVSFDGQ